ncbi:MAG TPA: hypothetical protein VHW45_20980 [Candidatus Sulfotelmatobacter sp.]|jgi:hypothetical protein|nr:hypothetical protein [Candidatus Sulfotelmatobacter sp.]
MRKLSAAASLTIWNLAIFAVLELLFGATMWFTLRRNLYDLVDNRVQTQIEDLNQFLRTQAAEAPVSELQQRLSEKYSQNHVGDFLELYLQSGESVYRSAFLQGNSDGLLPPDAVKRPLQRRVRIAGRPFRFLLQRMSANGRMFVVEMGTPAGDAVATLHRFQFRLFVMGSLLWLVAGFLVYSISRRIVTRRADENFPPVNLDRHP